MKSAILLSLAFGVSALFAVERVASPNGLVAVEFSLQEGGAPVYQIDYRGRPLVLASRLGFPDFNAGFTQTRATRNQHRGEWTQEFGERRRVPDNFNEVAVDLRHTSGRLLRVTLRACDEGAAFRYTFPDQATKTLEFAAGELTEFRFPAGTFGWEEQGTEGEYHRTPVGAITPYCERPLTLEFASGAFASLAEAANTAYPRMLLSPIPGAADALVTALGGSSSNLARVAEFAQRHDPSIKLTAGESTPWRMFVVGDQPGDLLERNYLMLNLNPPSALTDASWIKPGKAMRDTTLTTANSKAIIDFAATGGLDYVHLDWKWYGPVEFEAAGETIVRAPNLDVPEIIRYGREKGVGLILYVDRRQLKRDREKIFAMFEQWGVAGVKIGFVDVGPQTETAWITETIRQAAKHRLMLNIHDGYRSTGLSRTWPHLMTVEGIRGNEHFPTAEHNCTLPFTRYVAGVGDYTVCYYDKRLTKTTHAHQLAMAVVSFSPLQWIFWYDRPSQYHGEPEVEFFRAVPTVWDETKVIHGRIGEFATIARRKGDAWFVGTINAKEPRTLCVPLAFLAPGKKYTAHLYSDDATAATATKVGVTTRTVDSTVTLEVPLLATGGQAIWIEPL
ncbi:MAG: glycoside hydrolase family 97 catalytic domain-containing protein [Verrucomicrobia bacterium]|nr:glycoside hydrolase family 97 catalytic domain-containing protein [Verrucomicrobiota bacterium]